MKIIVFDWSNVRHTGYITEQIPHSIQGQRTNIKVLKPIEMEFVVYGKCEVGKCPPINVISIS